MGLNILNFSFIKDKRIVSIIFTPIETKAQKIEKLIEAMGIEKNYLVMVSQGMDALIAGIIKDNTEITLEELDDLKARCLEKLGLLRSDMAREFIRLYDKYFSEEEIEGLLCHFTSPLGKKLIEIMPALNKEFLDVSSRYAEKIKKEISDEIINEQKKQLGDFFVITPKGSVFR